MADIALQVCPSPPAAENHWGLRQIHLLVLMKWQKDINVSISTRNPTKNLLLDIQCGNVKHCVKESYINPSTKAFLKVHLTPKYFFSFK